MIGPRRDPKVVMTVKPIAAIHREELRLYQRWVGDFESVQGMDRQTKERLLPLVQRQAHELAAARVRWNYAVQFVGWIVITLTVATFGLGVAGLLVPFQPLRSEVNGLLPALSTTFIILGFPVLSLLLRLRAARSSGRYPELAAASALLRALVVLERLGEQPPQRHDRSEVAEQIEVAAVIVERYGLGVTEECSPTATHYGKRQLRERAAGLRKLEVKALIPSAKSLTDLKKGLAEAAVHCLQGHWASLPASKPKGVPVLDRVPWLRPPLWAASIISLVLGGLWFAGVHVIPNQPLLLIVPALIATLDDGSRKLLVLLAEIKDAVLGAAKSGG